MEGGDRREGNNSCKAEALNSMLMLSALLYVNHFMRLVNSDKMLAMQNEKGMQGIDCRVRNKIKGWFFWHACRELIAAQTCSACLGNQLLRQSSAGSLSNDLSSWPCLLPTSKCWLAVEQGPLVATQASQHTQ